MPFRSSLRLLVITAGLCAAVAQEEPSDKDLQKESDAYMRDELGVNDITTPSIAQVLKDLGAFQPIAFDVIAENPRDAVFENRLQTSLHIGSLVADGFVLTIAERANEVQDIGRALIRQSRALGIGERMTRRSKSLLDHSEQGDWQGMRQELIKTQADVEKSMLDLKDEQMAHMISLGGWLRGYQLAANSCATNYNAERARILTRVELMDYYIDRLDTLHPRLRKTEFVTQLTAKLKALRALASSSGDAAPSQADVQGMRDIANQIEAIILGPVDAEGRISKKPAQ